MERTSFALGALLIGFVGFAYVDSVSANRAALEAFDDAVQAQATLSYATSEPDQSLWSPTRRTVGSPPSA